LPAGDVGRSYLRVFHDNSFDLLASYQLGPQELVTAITSMAFKSSSTGKAEAAAAASNGGEDSPAFFVVGSAVIKMVRTGGGFGLSLFSSDFFC